MGKRRVPEREYEFAVTLAQLSPDDLKELRGVTLSRRWARAAPVRRWWHILQEQEIAEPLIIGGTGPKLNEPHQ